jgi:hypothetical protein
LNDGRSPRLQKGFNEKVLIVAVALPCVEEDRASVEETRAAVFEEFTEDSPGIGLEFDVQWHEIDHKKRKFCDQEDRRASGREVTKG